MRGSPGRARDGRERRAAPRWLAGAALAGGPGDPGDVEGRNLVIACRRAAGRPERRLRPGPELVVNVSAAGALGFTLPPEFRAPADRVLR